MMWRCRGPQTTYVEFGDERSLVMLICFESGRSPVAGLPPPEDDGITSHHGMLPCSCSGNLTLVVSRANHRLIPRFSLKVYKLCDVGPAYDVPR